MTDKERSYPALSFGDEWPEVKELQELLIERKAKITATGKFDRDTLRAVKEFQKARGLVEDGFVGSKTWAALTTKAETPSIVTLD